MRKSIADKIMTITLSSFVIKVLGFVFRIYLSNEIGTEGMGLYQLIVSVYALGATISASGISTALSRLIAIHPSNRTKILKNAIIITQIISWSVFVVIFINSEYICSYFIKDLRTINSIRIVSLSFPAIAVFACLSGYFNGLSKVKYPMLGQIIEQLIRIFFIVSLVSRAIRNGVEAALVITSWGIVLGEYVSMAFLYMKYKLNSKPDRYVIAKRGYIKDIIKISVPVSLNGYFQSFIHTLENMIIPGRFIMWGYTHSKSLEFLGMIKGMAMPLVFFPTVVLSAVSTVSLPHISIAQSNKDMDGIKRAAKKSLILSGITGVGIMVFFIVAGKNISMLLYKNSEVALILEKMSIVIPFMYINITLSGILNGMGKQTSIMVSGISGGIVRTGLIMVLIPLFGLDGYILSSLISELIVAGMNFTGMVIGMKK